MLRRSVGLRALKVPDNIADWSRLGTRMQTMTVGKCFDTTVFDKSVIPTKHLQDSLFRLPIPKLEDTCKRYVDSVEPLLPPAQFAKTKALVDEFAKPGGEGAALHDELLRVDKANQHTSYISADWFDLYLKDRTPLPINYNPALIARNDPDKPDGLVRAAFWIASSVRMWRAYRSGTLKPEVFFFGDKNHYSRSDWFLRTVALTPRFLSAKVMAIGSKFMAFPLDMSQYDNLFCSTRIPRTLVDEIRSVPDATHIVVNYRGHQFEVNVSDASTGEPLPEEQIYARLKAIVATNVTPASNDVGVFTAMNRTEWCSTRLTMERSPKNLESFERVDSALFVLNLDLDRSADFVTSAGAVDAGRRFLVHDMNRWWDKSLSVTVFKDGALGVGFEHSWGDGVAVLRYTQDVFNDSINRSAAAMNRSAAATERVSQLQWSLTPELEAQCATAKRKLSAEMQRMDYHVGVLDAFGKSDKVFKGKIKPDPFMQVAMQLAWWRLNKSTVSTYESASTAAFLKGRTECIRSATKESQRFTLLFDSPTATADEKVKALAAAAAKHAAISKDAKMGNGVDRHLFALRKVAERRTPDKKPAVFADPAYETFGSNILSTSSLFSEALVGGGFGPVSPGYGIGYAAADDMMLFNISCWKQGGPNHSAADFARAIYESAVDMHNLLSANPPAKSDSK